MFKHNRKSFAARLGLPVALLGALVLTMSSPAVAATGYGSGSGTYDITSSTISTTCAYTTGFSYSGTGSGSYSAGSNANYSGYLDFTLDATSAFYESYLGTYGTSDSTCSGTPGTTVPVSATSSGSNANGSVSCSYTGTYRRVQDENGVDQITIVLNGTCTVSQTGGTTVTNSPTHEVRTGTFTSCSNDGPPPSSCDDSFTFVATNN